MKAPRLLFREHLPFWKKPFLWLLLAAVLLVSFCTGFLYLPEPAESIAGFDRAEIEEALLQAEKVFSEDSSNTLLREKVLFYKTALDFSLPIWGTAFAAEGAAAYARLLLRQESTGEDLSEEISCLEKILLQGDAPGLVSFLAEERMREGTLSREEIAKEKETNELLFSMDASASPGQSALFYDIALLKQSLRENKDFFRGNEKALSESDRDRFSALLDLRLDEYRKGEFDPVPANADTLQAGERITALLITLLLLLSAGKIRVKEKEEPSNGLCARLLLLHLALLLLFVFLSSLVLLLSTRLFAPGTVRNVAIPWGKDFLSVPFYPALLLRLLCRCLADLFPLLLCFFLRVRKGAGGNLKAVAFLPLLRYILCSIPLLPAGISFAFSLICPEAALFPDLSSYSTPTAPLWMSLSLWLLLTAIPLYLMFRQKKRS